jgi:hypothetical protein
MISYVESKTVELIEANEWWFPRSLRGKLGDVGEKKQNSS